jgi:threonine dehydratase
MNSTVGEARLQIEPSISAIRAAQEFLGKYFGPTRLIAAPFLSRSVGKKVNLKLEKELSRS